MLQPQTKKETLKITGIVFLTIILTLLIRPWAAEKLHRALMTQEELVEDTTSATTQTITPEDSVSVTTGKISRSLFESGYSAEVWYREFRANKVAFDHRYNHKPIDVVGTITNISNDGCATIEMEAGETSFQNITFINCNYGEDKWTAEVMEVAVGNQVHIRGYYNAAISSDLEMDIAKCHIIKD